MNFHALLPKLLTMIMSWLDAGKLRYRFYNLNDKLEIARLALEDMQRIDDPKLIRDLARRTLDQL